MNRFKISIGILLALVVLCCTELWVLHSQCSRFTGQIERAISAAETEDPDAVLHEIEQLEEAWEGFHDRTGLFIDRSKLDPIREILTGLEPLARAQHPELPAELDRLLALTDGLLQEELPELWHIL